MDPLTHALVGGMVGKSSASSSKRTAILVFLSVFPDFDVVSGFFGSWASIFYHRGFTHSLLGVLLFSSVISFLFRTIDAGPALQRFALYLTTMGLHLFLDAITGFGVPFFSPLTLKGYSIGLVGGLGLIPIPLMILIFVLEIYRDVSPRKSLFLFVGIWIFFLGAMGLIKANVQKLTKNHGQFLELLPTNYNPFHWRGVESNVESHEYVVYDINALSHFVQFVTRVEMPDQNGPVQATLIDSTVQQFMTQNKWPVARFLKINSGWLVEWGTLLFSTRGMVRSKLIVELDQDEHILSIKKSYGFWNPGEKN